MRKRLLMGLAGLGMLALPLTFNPTALVAGGEVIAANDASCQATECTYELLKICSTFNQDHIDYRCSKGCEGPGTE